MTQEAFQDVRVRRLLILDDDPDVGNTIAGIGRASGLEARAVTDASLFFRLLDDWTPHLLIVDLVMPGMDGVEVIHALAHRKSSARLIISSGVGARVLDAARRAAAEQGLKITGVLPKPFHAAQLRDQLTRALEQPNEPSAGARATPAAAPILETELHAAVKDRQFVPWYQPKVDCQSGALVGFEALARWQHPTRGLIMPDRFIPLAEKCGAIEDLTWQMLEESLAWLARHYAESSIGMAVNVSATCFGQTGFSDEVQQRCRACGINHGRLTLELTETAAMSDPIASLAQLTRLRMHGFQLSIDDFGSGFSSMVQLVRLPFSEMKVDRSFVMTALQSQESRAVVTCIAGLARSLGLTVTAEGVEDLAVNQFLVEAGCHHAQGYGISRPLTPERILAWAEHWETERAAKWGG